MEEEVKAEDVMEDKAKLIFLVGDNGLVEKKIYLYKSGENSVTAFSYLGEDRKKEPDAVMDIKIKKASWGIIKRIQDLSTTISFMGSVNVNPELLVENTVRYLLNNIEGYPFEFSKDDEGVEKISDSDWKKISMGSEAIIPDVMVAIHMAIKEVNGSII